MHIKKRIEFLVLKIGYLINMIIPKNSKQVFFYSMPDFSDNARELYEELVRLGLDKEYQVIWAVRDKEKYKEMLPDVVVVKHRSISNFYHFCRSFYIIRTHSLWGNYYVRKRQLMFVAWHGMPLKSLLEGDPKPQKCDYINTTSDFFKEHLYSSVAKPSTDNPNVGLARNDLLFRPNNILADFRMDSFSKIYLWMPTFRKSIYNDFGEGKEGECGLPVVVLNDLVIINNILKEKNELLILKLHPWSADKLKTLEFSNIISIRDADFQPRHTLYELIGQIDVLITDYSSVYIDFLLLNKPIWFVYDDIDEYRDTRGFAFEPAEDYMPGIKIQSTEELVACFWGGYDDNNYRLLRESICKDFHQFKDGNSAYRALKLMGIINENE